MFKSKIRTLFDRKTSSNRRGWSALRLEQLENRLTLSSAAVLHVLPPPGNPTIISTVPPSPAPAEQNPYGVAIAPLNFVGGGVLHAGDTLVANFNGASGVQGTGTTIVRITPSGQVSTFFTSKLLGVTTTPVILSSGFVVVGNVPNTGNGDAGPGALQVLDKNGHLVETLTDSTLLKDPWGLAANDLGKSFQLFVSNVSGTTTATSRGTVTRVDMTIRNGVPKVQDMVQIASGYATRLDPGAFIVGPGGMAYDARTETLYVASEAEKVKGVETGTIFAIPEADETFRDHGKGIVVFADATHLHGPMGLALTPNGDLITANADAVNVDPKQLSELVEFTTGGRFVSQFSVDPNDAGSAFAVAFGIIGGKERFEAVDDFNSTLDVWTVAGPVAGQNGDNDSLVNQLSKHVNAATDAVIAIFFNGNNG